MEAWGRGIPDIFDLCKAGGLPKPEFELAHMKLDKEQKRVLKAFWPAIIVFPFGYPLFMWINLDLTNRFREGFVFSYISAVVGGRHPYNPLEVSAEKAL